MKLTKELKYAAILAACINIAFLCSGAFVLALGWTSPQSAIFITLFMFVYHTDIRVLVGLVFSKFIGAKISVQAKAYVVGEGEYNFLCKIGVKKWKDRFVAWDRTLFVLQKMDVDRMKLVLQNNINAELTHWVCFFVGLLAIPLGLLLSRDEWLIYVLTSAATSLLADLPPICIQRFNRYRLQKIYTAYSRSHNK